MLLQIDYGLRIVGLLHVSFPTLIRLEALKSFENPRTQQSPAKINSLSRTTSGRTLPLQDVLCEILISLSSLTF